MASLPRVGTVRELDFVRDAVWGFFIGERFVEESPHRNCFRILNGEMLKSCVMCDKWRKCELPWKEKSL
jgi:hypothetical protein